MPVVRVLRIPERICDAMSEYCELTKTDWHSLILFALDHYLYQVTEVWDMWVVNVRRTMRDYVAVWLGEVRKLDNGVLITTGRRTPGYALQTPVAPRSLDTLAKQLASSLDSVVAESLLQRGEDELMIAAELAERIGGVLIDQE